MVLFGRKKKEEVKEPEVKLPDITQILPEKREETEVKKEAHETPKIEEKKEEVPEKKKEIVEEKPRSERREIVPQASFPLFVKLERYDQILRTFEELKNVVELLKEFYDSLEEVEMMREDCMRRFKYLLKSVEKIVSRLDSQFVKPTGYEYMAPPEVETEEITQALSELKKRIQELKKQLQAVA